MKNDKVYNKLYQRKLYEIQRHEKSYCDLCKCEVISHFLNKHVRTKKHQLNFLKEENNRLINLLNPLNLTIQSTANLDSEALEIVDV